MDSGSVVWHAFIDEGQITEPVVHNDSSSSSKMNFHLEFNFQTIKRWMSYDDDSHILMEDLGPSTSTFTSVDFGAVYEDLKQHLLTNLVNYEPQNFKDDVVDAIIRHAHTIACTDEKRSLIISILRYVFYFVDGTSLDSWLNDSPNMVPASMDVIISLPKKEMDYKDAGDEIEGCMVCLEEIEAGLVVTTLPCSHIFHNFCISEWLKRSHYCPICRFEMPIAQ
ncbi:RING finger protein [Forsythia ovata]|uniref:RING-type E3 ubiquitin transferase n=1 Tax=Forsythia ovata TaxID=205694 RepID=A0ABD1TBL0_9LAMI